jgi:hypothetical protein
MIMGMETFKQAAHAQLSPFRGLIEPHALKMPQNGPARPIC